MKAKWVVCLVVLVVSGAVAYGATPSFQGLGFLPGGSNSEAYDISADGRVVVGVAGSEPFRWTQQMGMVGLGTLDVYNYARGVSADGSVIVGYSKGTGIGFNQAWRWTESEGLVSLSHSASNDGGRAEGCSADGSVICGSYMYDYQACIWTGDNQVVELGYLPGGTCGSFANGISSDGSVVVGSSHSSGGWQPYRWTEANGMVGLGHLPGGSNGGGAYACSPDGSIVVGSTDCASGDEAFRWTDEEGLEGLGELTGGGYSSVAFDVSADGSIIVGRSNTSFVDPWYGAFIWDETNGMRNLQDVLAQEFGLDMGGWILRSAEGVSDDGTAIVGVGINPDGQFEAWVATVPEPATMSLLAVGAVALLKRKRKSCGIRRRRK